MSGDTIRPGPKTEFVFTGVAASSSQTQIIARGIDVSQFREVTLVVRVFDVTIAQAGATIDVEVYPDGQTEEDPSVNQLWQTAACAVSSLGSTTTAYSYHLAFLDDAPMGATIAIVVTGTQAATPGNLEATLSVELVRRT